MAQSHRTPSGTEDYRFESRQGFRTLCVAMLLAVTYFECVYWSEINYLFNYSPLGQNTETTALAIGLEGCF
jgi:hypothetical protein